MQFLQTLRRRILSVDQKIQIKVDRYFSSNLKFRYLLALSLIAFLTFSGQITIQSALTAQNFHFERIRVSERQIDLSDKLGESIVSLSLSSDLDKFNRRMGEAKTQLKYLMDNFHILRNQDYAWISAPKVESVRNLQQTIEITEKFGRWLGTLEKIIVKKFNSPEDAAAVDFEVTTMTENLIDLNKNLRTALDDLNLTYVISMNEAIAFVRQLEWTLLILTFLVLLFEGLYIFRPAVSSLYRALAVRSEFLGKVSHELRNPLNTILGMSHLLEKTELSPHQLRYVELQKRSSSILLDTLNSILDFTSIDSKKLKLDPVSFAPNELVERVADVSSYSAYEKSVDIVLDLDPKLPAEVIGDSSRLQQILANLIGNAVKFTEQGSVQITVRQVGSTENEVQVYFEVRDTGIGIDPEKISHIFESFVQGDSSIRRKYGGAGLGLTISSRFVELLGGHLDVESEKGKGSRFYFTLAFPVARWDSLLDRLGGRPLEGEEVILLAEHPSYYDKFSRMIEVAGARIQRFQLDDFLDGKIELNLTPRHLLCVDVGDSKKKLDAFQDKVTHLETASLRLIYFLSHDFSLQHPAVQNRDLSILFKPIKVVEFLEKVEQKKLPQASPSPESFTPPSSFAGLKILVVDDTQENLILLKEFLSVLGVEPDLQGGGKEGWDRYRDQEFDLVLLDIQMPEMDGIQVAKAIRKWDKVKRKSSCIAALTAHGPEELVEMDAKLFDFYLVKPVILSDLENLVRSVHLSKVKGNRVENRQEKLSRLQERIKKMGPSYVANRFEDMDRLKKSILEKDFKKISGIGHQLKGNAKTYGFERLGELGAVLEVAALQSDEAEVKKVVESIEIYLEKVKRKMG